MQTQFTVREADVRERALEHGMSFPFDEELVMMILGSGTKELPIEKLSRIVIDTLNDSNTDEIVKNLLKIKGVGKSKALAIASALELGRRRSQHIKGLIRTPQDVIPFVRNYSVSEKEHLILVTLNGGHEIIETTVVSIGTLNKTLIHPREVFSVAIKHNAAAMLLCHNHPSGNCSPSPEDIEATEILLAASKIMGIELLDHVIIDKETYFSFVEHNLLFAQEE